MESLARYTMKTAADLAAANLHSAHIAASVEPEAATGPARVLVASEDLDRARAVVVPATTDESPLRARRRRSLALIFAVFVLLFLSSSVGYLQCFYMAG